MPDIPVTNAWVLVAFMVCATIVVLNVLDGRKQR